MHHFFRLCAVVICALALQAHAAPVACTASETAVAQKAATDARTAIAGAIAAIDSGDKAALDRLDRWLGAKNSAEAQAVKARLTKVGAWLVKPIFLCENQTQIRIGDVYAYVTPQKDFIITLTVHFFQALDKGALESKLGVVVHEASHFDIAGDSKDPKVYGPKQALALAKSSPSQAQGNAENIEYFVESLHFKLTP
jgi:hypothetical protein